MADANAKDPHAFSPLHLLHRAGQCADELFAIKVGRADITPRQFEVLRAVSRSDEPSQTQLVSQTGIDRSTLADIVRRLSERGLIDRQRTRRDARTYAVRLSASGEAALKAAEPGVNDANARILDLLPEAQRETFLQALSKIVADVGADDDDVATSDVATSDVGSAARQNRQANAA